MKTQRLLVLGLLFWGGWPGWAAGQVQKRSLPPPLRIHVPFDVAWKTMLSTLGENHWPISSHDLPSGAILTEFVEYSSGPLTGSHIAKIGERPKLPDGGWVRVKYQYEIEILLLNERETLVTVNANIRALERQFLGQEKWVDIPSNGRLEENLLTLYGRNLFGQTFSLATPKKGFWEHSPGYVPDAEIRPYVVGPERKRP